MAIPVDHVCFFTMDNISGSTLIDESGSYNGTLVGDFTSSPAVFGDGIKNDNVNSYIDVPSLGSWFSGKSAFTITLNCRFVAAGAGTQFLFGVSYSTHSDPYYIVSIDVNNTNITLNVGGYTYILTHDLDTSTDFFHAAILYNAGTVDLLINNIVVATMSSVPTTLPATMSNAMFGRIPAHNSSLNAALFNIDQFRIFDRVLTNTELTDIYAEGRWKISGLVTESNINEQFIASAFDFEDNTYRGSSDVNLGAYSIPLGIYSPCFIVVSAKMGGVWAGNKTILLDDKMFASDTITTPYYYKCTQGGTTAATEPVLTQIPGNTTADGTVIWQCVERLIQPMIHGPLIPEYRWPTLPVVILPFRLMRIILRQVILILMPMMVQVYLIRQIQAISQAQ